MPKKEYLRLTFFNQKKIKHSKAIHCMWKFMVNTQHTPSEFSCGRYFDRFERGDHDVKDNERPGQSM